MDKVAIIMSLYINDSKDEFLKAIGSLIEQTYSVDIFLFIDGYLNDDLNQVVSEYSVLDNIYIYYSKENLGLAKAMNFLIDEVSNKEYDFIARMDSDDICHSDRILKQVQFFKKHPEVDILGTGCVEFGASYALDKKILPLSHYELKSFSITRCPFIHPTVMFRCSIFNQGYRYPENTSFTEDMGLWFTLLDNGFTFANLDSCLLYYRLNENTVNRRRGWRKATSEIRLRLQYMFKLKEVSFSNLCKIFSRVVFHMMPTSIMKIMYKKMR